MKTKKSASIFLLTVFVSGLLFGSTFSGANAQVAKMVHISTPGTLTTLLTQSEKASVTHLTLTGKIDARDLKTTRDSLPLIEEVDLKGVGIVAYEGVERGTAPDWYSNPLYPANVLPLYSFEKKGIKKIVLPDSIITIDQHAFQSCKKLEQIILGNYLQEIGTEAFINCTQLSSINLSDSLKIIGENVFFSCTSIVELVIPACVHTIKNAAFGSGFKGVLRVSENNPVFMSIDGVIFKKDTSELVSSPSLHSTYVVPEPVTHIGNYSFYYNKKIESLTFPETLKSIGSRAFDGNSNISSIVFNSEIPPTEGWLSLRNINTETCVLYVPVGAVENYKGAGGWSDFKNIVETGATAISHKQFNDKATIFISGGMLHLKDVQPGSLVEIYSLQGALIQRYTVSNTGTFPLPKGLFLVRIGQSVTKVLNR